MSSLPRIKLKTRSGNRKKYGGTPKELSPVDLPTYRDCIQHFYYLQDLDPQLTASQLTQQLSDDVIKVWRKVNSGLPLILPKTVD